MSWKLENDELINILKKLHWFWETPSLSKMWLLIIHSKFDFFLTPPPLFAQCHFLCRFFLFEVFPYIFNLVKKRQWCLQGIYLYISEHIRMWSYNLTEFKNQNFPLILNKKSGGRFQPFLRGPQFPPILVVPCGIWQD